jgi:hypothetical protein
MGKAGKMNTSVTSFWKSFDILDDYTIRVNHAQWQNRMIRSFAAATTYLISPSAYEKNGLEWIRGTW